MTEESTAREGVEPEVDTEKKAPDAEAPEPEETAPDAEADASDDAEGEGEEQPPEEVEIDFGGNKKRWVKGTPIEEVAEDVQGFAKGLWSDYTKEKQGIAERSKSLEAREKAVEKIAALDGETLEMFSHGKAIRREIEQLAKVDYQSLWQSDPDRARQLSDHLSRKQAELQSIAMAVGQKEQELAGARQQEVSRRMAEGKDILDKRVKNFSTEHLPAVLEYAQKSLGMSKEEAESGWALNPSLTLAVFKAMKLDGMQTEAKRPKPTAPAVPVAPVAKAKGGAKPRLDLVKDAAKIPPEEWARRRNREIAQKRAAGR